MGQLIPISLCSEHFCWSVQMRNICWCGKVIFSSVLFSGLCNLALHHSIGGKGKWEQQTGRVNTKGVKIYWGSNKLLEGKSPCSWIDPPMPSQHDILGKYQPAVSLCGDLGSSSCQEGSQEQLTRSATLLCMIIIQYVKVCQQKLYKKLTGAEQEDEGVCYYSLQWRLLQSYKK